MLEIGSDLVASAQIEEEGERVDVGRSAQEHCHLGWTLVKEDYRPSSVNSSVFRNLQILFSFVFCFLNGIDPPRAQAKAMANCFAAIL